MDDLEIKPVVVDYVPVFVSIKEMQDERKENDEEISNKIDQFWKTIRKDWPNFQKCDILKLFYGNGTHLKGLFSHCGDNLEKNSLGSENCLNLLSKLIYDIARM